MTRLSSIDNVTERVVVSLILKEGLCMKMVSGSSFVLVLLVLSCHVAMSQDGEFLKKWVEDVEMATLSDASTQQEDDACLRAGDKVKDDKVLEPLTRDQLKLPDALVGGLVESVEPIVELLPPLFNAIKNILNYAGGQKEKICKQYPHNGFTICELSCEIEALRVGKIVYDRLKARGCMPVTEEQEKDFRENVEARRAFLEKLLSLEIVISNQQNKKECSEGEGKEGECGQACN